MSWRDRQAAKRGLRWADAALDRVNQEEIADAQRRGVKPQESERWLRANARVGDALANPNLPRRHR